jgi:hypothetical protein
MRFSEIPKTKEGGRPGESAKNSITSCIHVVILFLLDTGMIVAQILGVSKIGLMVWMSHV